MGARGCARLGCIMMDGGHRRDVCADDKLETDERDGGGVQGRAKAWERFDTGVGPGIDSLRVD